MPIQRPSTPWPDDRGQVAVRMENRPQGCRGRAGSRGNLSVAGALDREGRPAAANPVLSIAHTAQEQLHDTVTVTWGREASSCLKTHLPITHSLVLRSQRLPRLSECWETTEGRQHAQLPDFSTRHLARVRTGDARLCLSYHLDALPLASLSERPRQGQAPAAGGLWRPTWGMSSSAKCS